MDFGLTMNGKSLFSAHEAFSDYHENEIFLAFQFGDIQSKPGVLTPAFTFCLNLSNIVLL